LSTFGGGGLAVVTIAAVRSGRRDILDGDQRPGLREASEQAAICVVGETAGPSWR